MNFKTKKEATRHGKTLTKHLDEGWELNISPDYRLDGTVYFLELVNKSMSLDVIVEDVGFTFYHKKLNITISRKSMKEGIEGVRTIISGIIQEYSEYLAAISLEDQ